MNEALLVEQRCRDAVRGAAEAAYSDVDLLAYANGTRALGDGDVGEEGRRNTLALQWHDNTQELRRTEEEVSPEGLLPADARASLRHLRDHAGLVAQAAAALRGGAGSAEGAAAQPPAALADANEAQRLAMGKAFQLDALFLRLLGLWFDCMVLWTNTGTVAGQPVPPIPAASNHRGNGDALDAAFVTAAAAAAVSASSAAATASSAFAAAAAGALAGQLDGYSAARFADIRARSAAQLAASRARFACDTSKAAEAVAAARLAVSSAAAAVPTSVPDAAGLPCAGRLTVVVSSWYPPFRSVRRCRTVVVCCSTPVFRTHFGCPEPVGLETLRALCCSGAAHWQCSWYGCHAWVQRRKATLRHLPHVLCVAAVSRALRRAGRRAWRAARSPRGRCALWPRLRAHAALSHGAPRELLAACWFLRSPCRPLTCLSRCCAVAREGFPVCRSPHATGLPIRMVAPTSRV